MNLPSSFSGFKYNTAAIAMAREKLNLQIKELGMSGRGGEDGKEELLPILRVYCSTHTHSSIAKAVILLGLGQRSNDRFEMNVEELEAQIEKDKTLSSGKVLPMCVIATIGTTSTTSVDPIAKIAEICNENIFLHIDAAYAGSALVLPELQHHLQGVEYADSLTTIP